MLCPCNFVPIWTNILINIHPCKWPIQRVSVSMPNHVLLFCFYNYCYVVCRLMNLGSLHRKYWPNIMFRINLNIFIYQQKCSSLWEWMMEIWWYKVSKMKTSFILLLVKIIQRWRPISQESENYDGYIWERALEELLLTRSGGKHLQIMFVYLWTRPHIVIIYNIGHGVRGGGREIRILNLLFAPALYNIRFHLM